MSNEMKDWLFDKFADVLLEAGVIDKEVQTIALYGEWSAIVIGLKNDIRVKYSVWFDDEEGWNYERSEE